MILHLPQTSKLKLGEGESLDFEHVTDNSEARMEILVCGTVGTTALSEIQHFMGPAPLYDPKPQIVGDGRYTHTF